MIANKSERERATARKMVQLAQRMPIIRTIRSWSSIQARRRRLDRAARRLSPFESATGRCCIAVPLATEHLPLELLGQVVRVFKSRRTAEQLPDFR